MKTMKSKGPESRQSGALFDYERSEQEADRISSRFKNSSDVKGAMSSQMGIDFSGVRVHQDATADQQTRELGTAAFTRGSEIFMGNTDTLSRAGASESQVLAHELTHTVQQGAASQPGGGISQAAPTGAVQMWSNPFMKMINHFRNRKKGGAATPAAAAPAPAPARAPAPAPAPAVQNPDLAPGAVVDYSKFIPRGQKTLSDSTTGVTGRGWSMNPSLGKSKNSGAMMVTANLRENTMANPLFEASKPMVAHMQERGSREASNTPAMQGLLADRNMVEHIGGLGTTESRQDPAFQGLSAQYSENIFENVDSQLEDPEVAKALQAHNMILNGAGGDSATMLNDPSVRANALYTNYMLRVAGPNAQRMGTTLATQGDVAGSRAITKLSQGVLQISNHVSVSLLGHSDRPGFDLENLDDATVNDVVTALAHSSEDKDLIVSPAIVRKVAHLMSKCGSIGASNPVAATAAAVTAAVPAVTATAPAAAVTPSAVGAVFDAAASAPAPTPPTSLPGMATPLQAGGAQPLAAPPPSLPSMAMPLQARGAQPLIVPPPSLPSAAVGGRRPPIKVNPAILRRRPRA